MGICLEYIFHSNKSSVLQSKIINVSQLNQIIKQTTKNDQFFYSSKNLFIVQEYLNNFKINSSIDQQFIKKNTQILSQFIQNLKNKSSIQYLQYISDTRLLQSFLNQSKTSPKQNHPQIKLSDLIILKIQIQTLLITIPLLKKLGEQDLVLQITQNQSQNYKYNIQNTTPHHQQQLLITTLLLHAQKYGQQTKKYQTKSPKRKHTTLIQLSHSESYSKQRFQSHQIVRQNTIRLTRQLSKIMQQTGQNQLKLFPIFETSSKLVLRGSKINFSLFKIKKKNNNQCIATNKATIYSNSQHITKPQNDNNEEKVLLANTSLSVTDFIYYNSLMVSDVVPMSNPNLSKATFNRGTDQSITSNSPVFLSLRGQGLQAQTLQADFNKIIKQHQIIHGQLCACVDGEKVWQKLQDRKKLCSHQSVSPRIDSNYSEFSNHKAYFG